MKLLSRKTYLLIFLTILLVGFSYSAFAAESQATMPKYDWKMSESPEIEVKFSGRGIAERVFDWATFPVREKKVIFAKLTSAADGQTRDLEAGDDFSVDFSSGGAKIALSPKLEMKPGKQTLEAKIASAGEEYAIKQDFTWGVLAINVNKSIYSPGETAKMQFGVLDEKGNMVCDAKLELRIMKHGTWNMESKEDVLSSENGRIKVNAETCQSKVFTLEPDYWAEYKTGGEGKYEMTLTAETGNGTYAIQDSFEVSNAISFDVERTSATRIYPLNKYPVVFDIVANQDFEGEIRESVPGNFEILNPKPEILNKFKIQNSNNKNSGEKEIVWNVDMKKGDKLKLEYEYDAPDVSPEFYLLGPLKFSEEGRTILEEARQWQIASDATLSLYVDTVVSSGAWTQTGTTPYLNAQDQPTNYTYSTTRNADSSVFGFADTSQTGTINSVTLYIYAYGAAETNFDTFVNSTNTGLGPPASWGWVSYDVSSILTTWSAINSATIYFDRPNTTNDAGVDAAYLYVDYTAANVAPTLNVDNPASDTDVADGASYNIQYDLTDGDSDATVDFYYETDGNGTGGTAISTCQNRGEGIDQTCSFSPLSEGMSLSTYYYIYGVATDGSNPDVTDISTGRIRVNDAPTLEITEPDGIGDTVTQGSDYTIYFNLADTDSTVTVDLYYDADGLGLDGTAITGCSNLAQGSSQTCIWDTTGVTPDTYYIYGRDVSDGVNTEVTDYSAGEVTVSAYTPDNVGHSSTFEGTANFEGSFDLY